MGGHSFESWNPEGREPGVLISKCKPRRCLNSRRKREPLTPHHFTPHHFTSSGLTLWIGPASNEGRSVSAQFMALHSNLRWRPPHLEHPDSCHLRHICISFPVEERWAQGLLKHGKPAATPQLTEGPQPRAADSHANHLNSASCHSPPL